MADENPTPETPIEGVQSAMDEAANPPKSGDAPKPESSGNGKEPEPAKPETKDPDPEQQDAPDPDTLPIKDWSKVDLGLGKDLPVDKDLLDSFGEMAVKAGMSKAQAKAAVEWQLNAIAEADKAYKKDQETALKKAWGKKMDANKTRVLELINRVDGMEGNSGFAKALGSSGAADNAMILQGLLSVAEMLAEDRLGAGSSSGSGGKVESALDGIKAVYANGGIG